MINKKIGLSDSFYKKYNRYTIVVSIDHDLVIHQKDPIEVLEKVLLLYIKNYGDLKLPWYKQIFKKL